MEGSRSKSDKREIRIPLVPFCTTHWFPIFSDIYLCISNISLLLFWCSIFFNKTTKEDNLPGSASLSKLRILLPLAIIGTILTRLLLCWKLTVLVIFYPSEYPLFEPTSNAIIPCTKFICGSMHTIGLRHALTYQLTKFDIVLAKKTKNVSKFFRMIQVRIFCSKNNTILFLQMRQSW